MAGHTPVETVNELVDAFQRADAQAAVALYESGAVLANAAGEPARGTDELRVALRELIALRPTLTTERHEVIEVGDVALYCSRWRLDGTAPDGTPVTQEGESSDVLRRGTDGRWRIVIDSPFGAARIR